jgi:hypothetical protein
MNTSQDIVSWIESGAIFSSHGRQVLGASEDYSSSYGSSVNLGRLMMAISVGTWKTIWTLRGLRLGVVDGGMFLYIPTFSLCSAIDLANQAIFRVVGVIKGNSLRDYHISKFLFQNVNHFFHKKHENF